MTSILPKRKPILRIVLLSVAGILVLFILFVIGSLILSPVFDNFDKARFEKLDSQSRALYEQLNAVSGGSETWQYEAKCEDTNAGSGGFHPYSLYSCGTTLSTEVLVSSVSMLLTLQDKYYPVIDASDILQPVSELDKQLPGDFGLNFVSSSAEKIYTTTDGAMKCRYIIDLSDGKSIEYGLNLTANSGVTTISLSCIDKARGNWYE